MDFHVAAPRRHRRPPSRALPAVILLSAVLLAAGGLASTGGAAPAPEGAGPARPAAVETRPARPARPAAVEARPAVEVLRGWDEARAAAYASGSVGSLRELYGRGAGASDVRLLRSYLRRGYRVEGMRMQLLAVTVLAHRPGRWLLRVTDRLAGAEAVGYDERVALPRDRASTRTVRLARGEGGRWRVVAVRG